MNFRSISDLNQTILNNLYRIPSDIEVVVGVPRSGMLAAILFALHRNIAITDIDGLIEGKIMRVGSKTLMVDKYKQDYLKNSRKILIIDDSFHSGGTFEHVKSRIKKSGLTHQVKYSCVYGHLKAKGEVDFVFEYLLPPHIFEWNLSRNVVLENTCLDLDGIICNSPSSEEDDDGERYVKFVKNAKLLWKPERKVGWVVTSRLETYRKITEEWLKDNDIKYRHLVMMDVQDKRHRNVKAAAYYKARTYKKTNANLFIESDFEEAKVIAMHSKRSVFCFQTAQFIPMPKGEQIMIRLTSPKRWLESCFLYFGYLFKDFPEDHLIVGPIRKVGRNVYRFFRTTYKH